MSEKNNTLRAPTLENKINKAADLLTTSIKMKDSRITDDTISEKEIC